MKVSELEQKMLLTMLLSFNTNEIHVLPQATVTCTDYLKSISRQINDSLVNVRYSRYSIDQHFQRDRSLKSQVWKSRITKLYANIEISNKL